MKQLFSLLALSFGALNSFSQEMNYKFGHHFRSALLTKGSLFKITTGSANVTSTDITIPANQLILTDSAITLRNVSDILLTNNITVPTKTLVARTIPRSIKGTITKRTQDGTADSLFLKFWNFKEPGIPAVASDVSFADNGADFVFVINTAYWANHRILKIPYRTWQFTATNLPFRILTKTGDLESEFLNANLTFIKVLGTTKIYQSRFIKPRNYSWSFGPYLGLSAIDNKVTEKKEFGLNYGANIIYAYQSFNITAAFGFQNGFKKDTKLIQPYVGFGIGFKLIEFFEPEIKSDE